MQPYFYYLANKLALMELETALSPQKTFLIGAFANAIATLITYPVQVVQAKMRVSTNIFFKCHKPCVYFSCVYKIYLSSFLIFPRSMEVKCRKEMHKMVLLLLE